VYRRASTTSYCVYGRRGVENRGLFGAKILDGTTLNLLMYYLPWYSVASFRLRQSARWETRGEGCYSVHRNETWTFTRQIRPSQAAK